MDRREPDPSASDGSEIALRDLGYAVDGREILSGITLQTRAARVGIVGRNGSGKSTLARIVAGLIRPTSGQVRINGADLARDRRAALTQVGILFQNPDHQIIFPTVEEEISFGLRQMGRSKEAAASAARDTLDTFGKLHWQNASVSTLSQGQKHLVCLMAVAAMAPRLIILDEPFTGLDIPTKAQLRRYLAQYDGSLLHITHDPDDLAGYDHVVWIEKGAVARAGAARDVLPAYEGAMREMGGSDDISDLAG